MSRGPTATPITVTEDERAKLSAWVRRPTSAQRLAPPTIPETNL